MVRSSLASKWSKPVPFYGRDHQKSKFLLISGILSFGGCWGQPMVLFWKLVDETQISTPPEATRHHDSTKLLILLPLRAIYLRPFQSDTPCTWPFKSNKFSEKLWPHFVLRFSSSGYPTKVYYFSWSKLLLHHHPSSYLRDCQSRSSYYYCNLVGYLSTYYLGLNLGIHSKRMVF